MLKLLVAALLFLSLLTASAKTVQSAEAILPIRVTIISKADWDRMQKNNQDQPDDAMLETRPADKTNKYKDASQSALNLFQKIDANNDNHISKRELASHIPTSQLDGIFNGLNVDNNDYISFFEMELAEMKFNRFASGL